MVNKALAWFIKGWVGSIVILNTLAIIGILMTATTLWTGRIQETYSPFNIWNFIAEAISISPALLAYRWLRSRQQKQLKAA